MVAAIDDIRGLARTNQLRQVDAGIESSLSWDNDQPNRFQFQRIPQ